MRPKSLMLLVLALGCGLVASIGISQVMERRSAGGPEVEQVEVLVAKVEIPIGDAITPEKIKVVAVPKTLVPQDAFTDMEEVKDKRPRSKILVDDIIRAGKLADGEATQVPDGFRVVTIKATADRGANLLKPGDRVDVQVYIRAGAVPQIVQPTLKTFLSDVRVFAVDQKTEAAEEETGGAAARTVSLLVTPKQSQLVTLASNVGQVQLVMRSSLDKELTKTDDPVDVGDLVGGMTSNPGDRDTEKVASTPPDEPAEKPSGILGVIRDMTQPKEHHVAASGSFGHQMLMVEGTKITRFSFVDANKPPVEAVELGMGGPADPPAPPAAPMLPDVTVTPPGPGVPGDPTAVPPVEPAK